MITRMLEPYEGYRASLTAAVAFEGRCDYEKEKEANLALTDEEIDQILHPKGAPEPALPSESIRSPKCWATLSDGGETVYSCMNVHTYTVRFGANQTLMGGIGGVATLPPYRRMGGVRACMKAAFRDMYDNGYLFSALYPFSTAYYRQYGFEKGMPVHTWTLPLKDIRPVEAGGRIRQLLPGDSLEALTEIYNRFYEDYHLSVIRRTYDRKMDLEALLNQQRYVYLWENDAGEPRGFMITHRDGSVLDCTTTFAQRNGMLFLDAQAFQAMLTFAKTAFSADYNAIRFSTPACLPMDALIREGASASCKHSWNGMLRVVNVQRVLSLCRCRGEGSIILAVEDPLLPENQGNWRITFAPGKANQVEKTTDAPDITLPIGDFSVLICGVRPASDLPWMPEVQVHDPSVPFEQIFYPQNCHILDLF